MQKGVGVSESGRPFPHDHEGHGRHDDATAQVGRRVVGASETMRANRRWWDAAADDYQAEHGEFLGGSDAARFRWGPEGLDEADAQLLGPVANLAGRRVLEVGCGAAQCSRWLAAQGALSIAIDLSMGQLAHAAAHPGVRLIQADACAIPLADGERRPGVQCVRRVAVRRQFGRRAA
jgi:2-polyprenyl-3-methyl-5-hydroxy-6-metoxy-1,4-benzoquinol methylase